MKKFTSLMLILVLCLCTAMPALAASSFEWDALLYCNTFDILMNASMNQTTIWVDKDANTRVGTFPKSPEIIVTSQDGKVTSISMEMVLDMTAPNSSDAYDKGYGMGVALNCAFTTAAFIEDPASLFDDTVTAQFSADMQEMMAKATNKLDFTKNADIYTESLSFGNVLITCTSTFSKPSMELSVVFTLTPVN